MQQSFGNRLEILKKGYLVYKKSHKVYVMLCAPVSIADVATVYHSLFPGKEGIQNRAAILGNIAYAAMEETPVMILLQSEKNVTRPNFVHFIDVISVEDEVDIGAACSIRINTKDHVLYFSATTSTEYQGWINAFQEAYRQAHSNDNSIQNEMEVANEGFDIPEVSNNSGTKGLSQSFPRNSTISSSSSNFGGNNRISIFSDLSTSPEQVNRSASKKNSEPLFSRLFSACKNPDPDMAYRRKNSSRSQSQESI
ncbi:hypothetical protein BCR32DRAFT_291978 [Anaeromyces robustus]|uniref:PH domain-containing protein n=1 Tax=Anaeromyces robustus TaxID=1754192 RepID=A0A1Y1XCH5_9FUNG|nr:hypothetical protein BCR32DRAFT_291978 [Anaeromyces robustus]|eukprot:ORX83491.1 hypothetical protein BCR32DRAFT_291978 [Anaeromyces robustus]